MLKPEKIAEIFLNKKIISEEVAKKALINIKGKDILFIEYLIAAGVIDQEKSP